MLKYHQNSSNSCCFSSLASAFHIIGEDMAETELSNIIKESLTLQTDIYSNRTGFDNAIMTNRMNIKVGQHLIYHLKVWHKKGDFDILKNISEYVTLVQLMGSLVNVNRDISILGYCIFESGYDKSLCLTR